MATMFPQTLGGDPSQAYAPTGYVVPPELQAQIDAINKRRQQVPTPMYTPEQIQQRRDENERQYALGMLGGISGDEGLQNVGGQVLKQALANRQAKISERGTTDPLTGQFTYSPDYLAQRDDTAEAQAQQRIAQGRQQWDLARQAAIDKRELARQHAEDRAMLYGITASNRPERLIAVMDPATGQATLVPQSQASGMQPVGGGGKGGGNASEDERKAAGWLSQARLAFQNMNEATAADPSAAKPSGREIVTSLVPGVGRDVAYAGMNANRQKFTTAASSFSEAVLRAATGAGVNKEEALQKVQELTPRPGEAPSVTAMKQRMAEMYIGALEQRAGRALQQPPAAIDVSAALRRRQALPLSNPRPQPQGGNRVVDAGW